MNDQPAGAGTASAGPAGAPSPVRTGADLTASTAVRYALVAAPRLSLDAVARRSGLHPDLIRRFVALGLVDAERDAAGRLVFDPAAPAVLARVQRLRTGTLPQLRIHRPGARPARPHQPARSRPARPRHEE